MLGRKEKLKKKTFFVHFSSLFVMGGLLFISYRSVTTFSMTALSRTTFSRMDWCGLFPALSSQITDCTTPFNWCSDDCRNAACHNADCHNADCHNADCHLR
jgi:hypothetical protein